MSSSQNRTRSIGSSIHYIRNIFWEKKHTLPPDRHTYVRE